MPSRVLGKREFKESTRGPLRHDSEYEIVGGAKSRGKNFGKKSGLADTRKPDDGWKKVPVLHYTCTVV